MQKYYITGVPGIGKTTLMNALRKRGLEAFDIDYAPGLCQWVTRSTKQPVQFMPGASVDWHAAHAWICNIDILKKMLDDCKAEKVFVFGVADNQKEFLSLFDKVFLMRADEEIFMQRMAKRDENHFGHHEIDRKSVLNWYKDFEKSLIDAGALPIDASMTIDETLSTVLAESE